MKKLTGKQERVLRGALLADDLLFAKYTHMMQKIAAEHRRLIRDPQQILHVIGVKNGRLYRLAVTEVHVTPNGSVIKVQL